jgi:hypothetical protein
MMMPNTRPSLLMVGLPWDHPMGGTGGHHPEAIRKALEANQVLIKDAGYDFKAVYFGPEDGIAPLTDELNSRRTDGVIIGFGVRGNRALTVWFEMLVNTVREISPETKLVFNSSPDSTFDAVKRNLPLTLPNMS